MHETVWIDDKFSYPVAGNEPDTSLHRFLKETDRKVLGFRRNKYGQWEIKLMATGRS